MEYKVKHVMFPTRRIPIILQNTNGPCPLISICNVLLLRGGITIPSTPTISDVQLLQTLGNYIIENGLPQRSTTTLQIPLPSTATPVDQTPTSAMSRRANLEHTIEEVLELLPTLKTGINVNPKFTSVDAFEATAELSVFDIMGINLFHGWLVDPADVVTTRVIGDQSYNQLAEKLVAVQTLSTRSTQSSFSNRQQQEQQQQSHDNTDSNNTDSNNTDSNNTANTSSEVCAEVALIVPTTATDSPRQNTQRQQQQLHRPSLLIEHALESISESTSISTPPSASSAPATPSDKLRARHLFLDSQANVPITTTPVVSSVTSPKFSIPNAQEYSATTAASETTQQETEEDQRQALISEGQVIRNFLHENASQLTMYGLHCLHQRIADGDFSILFRNNHFATLYKHRGDLYTLCSDEGFERKIIWEKLAQTDGDSVFYDVNFRRFVEYPFDQQQQQPRAVQHPYTDAQQQQPASTTQADYELAVRLQRSERKAAAELRRQQELDREDDCVIL